MTPTPAAGEIAAAERRSLARRIGAAICAPSGFVLALCFFLPLAESCDTVDYPYDSPEFAAPYVFGLLALLAAIFLLASRRQLPRQASAAFASLTALATTSLSIFLGFGFAESLPKLGKDEWILAATSMLAAVLTYLDLHALIRKYPSHRMLGRSLWAGGAASLAWFTLIFCLFDYSEIYHGLVLSVAASAFLALGGALLEWGARGEEAVPVRGPPGAPI